MKPTHVIVHCSDSAWGDVNEVTRWHKARGFTTIGYHYLITNARPKSKGVDPSSDGKLHGGRSEDQVGAHALGFNDRSIGVCLIGRGAGDFTPAQLKAARVVVRNLMHRYQIPAANVLGHCETPQSGGKTCPNMDMNAFRESL